MTYLLIALAALVYLWPAGKQPAPAPEPPAEPPASPGLETALSAVAQIRSYLTRQGRYSEPCLQSLQTLTVAILDAVSP